MLAMLDRLRADRDEAAKSLKGLFDTVEARVADGDKNDELTDGEKSNADELNERLKTLDGRIKPLAEMIEREARSATVLATLPSKTEDRAAEVPLTGGVKVKTEVKTYTAESKHGWFKDCFERSTDPEAAARLERRQNEFDLDERATTTSSFNGLVPPQYLLAEFARVLRAGRVFPDLSTPKVLPPVGMSAVLTRGTVGTVVAVQGTQNVAPTLTDITTVDLTIPVVTLQGGQDISRQAAERGGINLDSEVMLDLAADYARMVGVQALFGTGASGQALGVENTASINAVTVSAVGVMAAGGLVPGLANALQLINTNRFAPADCIIMHPRRWGALTIAVDSAGRPIVTIDNPGFNTVGSGAAAATSGSTAGEAGTYATIQRVGSILGVDVYTDPNIRTNQGAGTNEDSVIVLRRGDSYVWENNGGAPQQFTFEQPVGPASIRLAVYGNFAYSAGRFPAGIARLSGVGLVPPVF